MVLGGILPYGTSLDVRVQKISQDISWLGVGLDSY